MHAAAAVGQVVDAHRHHLASGEGPGQGRGGRVVGGDTVGRHDDRAIGDIEIGVGGTEHPLLRSHFAGIEQFDQLETPTAGVERQLQGATVLPHHLGVGGGGVAGERALEAQAHQDLPFEQLVEALQPERSLSHNPLFQVLFNYQSEARGNGQAFRFDELQMESVQFDSRTAQFDLTLDLTDEEQRFCAVFDYATDLFDASTVERLAGHWRNLLRGIV